MPKSFEIKRNIVNIISIFLFIFFMKKLLIIVPFLFLFWCGFWQEKDNVINQVSQEKTEIVNSWELSTWATFTATWNIDAIDINELDIENTRESREFLQKVIDNPHLLEDYDCTKLEKQTNKDLCEDYKLGYKESLNNIN